MKWIYKVGLAAEYNGSLLVARKRGSDVFILPGGKPEGDENDLQTLAREITEELGCEFQRPFLRGVFTDVASGVSGAAVAVRLYSADLVGEPTPNSEIEELAWVDMRKPALKLAPSITNKVIPYLLRKRRGAPSALQSGSELLQGAFEIV